MTIKSTTKLLKKYESYVPGERRTRDLEKIHKQEQRLAEKHALCDELLNETKVLMLTNYEKEHVHYLIDKFKDFKKLHRNCKNEAIILAFIFYVAKINTPKRQLKEYSFTKKYGLSDNVFETIMCRVCQVLLSEAKIVPVGTTKYDHDLLSRTGQR